MSGNLLEIAYRLHPDLDERLAKRTPEQIREGRMEDCELDPRGYVVSCPRGCTWMAWGTPDNLPMDDIFERHDCPRNEDGSLRGRGVDGQ